MGEKKKKNFKSKTGVIPIRYPYDVIDKFEKEVKELNTDLSKYLRARIDNGKINVHKIDVSFEKIHFELNKIGVNLNQIAKVLNEKKTEISKPLLDDISSLNKKITKIIEQIESLLNKKNRE